MVDVSEGLNRLSLAGLSVEKKDRVPPLIPEVSVFRSMIRKIFSIVYFLMGNRFFLLVFPCCNLVCAFAAVFNGKSPILGAKVAKTTFLAFLSFFLGTSASALVIRHNKCKNVWELAHTF